MATCRALHGLLTGTVSSGNSHFPDPDVSPGTALSPTLAAYHCSPPWACKHPTGASLCRMHGDRRSLALGDQSPVARCCRCRCLLAASPEGSHRVSPPVLSSIEYVLWVERTRFAGSGYKIGPGVSPLSEGSWLQEVIVNWTLT